MRRTYLAALAALLASAGCASSQGSDHPVYGVTPDGVPRWVRHGSGVYDTEKGKALYGVGVVQGIRSISLARQTADNRARGEVAKILDTYVAALMRDYQRSTTAGDMKQSSEEQDVVAAQKTLTEATLRGVTVTDHYTDPATGALYALAVLDLDGIMKSLDRAKELNARVRDYVRANAARAFDQLDAALKKRRGQ